MDDEDYTPNEVVDEESDDERSIDVPRIGKRNTEINDSDDDDVPPPPPSNNYDDDDDDNDDDDDDDNDDDDDDNDDDIVSEVSENDILARMQSKTDGVNIADTDDDTDDDEADNDYLQKFDDSTRKSILADFHPELHAHNADEIANLCVIVRDAHGTPIDPLHRTIPILTRYEKARSLGERAKQINSGAKPFVTIDDNIIDGYLIALKELEEKKLPFIIKRPMPNGGCEYWKLSDLEILL